MEKVPTERKWYHCPKCGAKICLYNDVADCHGVYTVCSRGCRCIVELHIENGKQVTGKDESQ